LKQFIRKRLISQAWPTYSKNLLFRLQKLEQKSSQKSPQYRKILRIAICELRENAQATNALYDPQSFGGLVDEAFFGLASEKHRILHNLAPHTCSLMTQISHLEVAGHDMPMGSHSISESLNRKS